MDVPRYVYFIKELFIAEDLNHNSHSGQLIIIISLDSQSARRSPVASLEDVNSKVDMKRNISPEWHVNNYLHSWKLKFTINHLIV